MSSAQESMCTSGCAEIGMSCMKRLKRVGESADPYGTPWGKRLFVEGVLLCVGVSTCKIGRQPLLVCFDVGPVYFL